jgi:zinc protease
MTRATPPPDLPMRPSHLPIPDAHTLPNGVRVLTLPDSARPCGGVSAGAAVCRARLRRPRLGGAGVGDRAANDRGHADPHQLSKSPTKPTATGAASASVRTPRRRPSAHAACRHTLEPMTRLIADVLLHPTFPPDEVEIDRANTLQRLRLQRSQPGFLAEERFRVALFGAHPYARLAPDEDALQRWGTDELQAFHAARYRPAEATLLVVGDFRPRHAAAAAWRCARRMAGRDGNRACACAADADRRDGLAARAAPQLRAEPPDAGHAVPAARLRPTASPCNSRLACWDQERVRACF